MEEFTSDDLRTSVLLLFSYPDEGITVGVDDDGDLCIRTSHSKTTFIRLESLEMACERARAWLTIKDKMLDDE